jgi:precorrin-6B methylase 2
MDMNEITTKALQIGWHHPGPGGMSPTNLEALQALCGGAVTDGGQVADVGCWSGLSSVVLGLLGKQKNFKVKAIDWFKGSPKTSLEAAAKEIDVYEVCKANMRYFELLDVVEIIPEDSVTAASKFSDASFDFVFIDGNHQYLQVLRDIDAWWPKVKSGGVLSGHDCEFIIPFNNTREVNIFASGPTNPWNDVDQLVAHLGVCRAVSERFGKQTKIEDGLIWWVQK